MWAESPIKSAAEKFVVTQFSDNVNLSMHTLTLPSALKLKVQKNVKQTFYRDNLYYWEITNEDSTLAYAFLDNVIGKSMPITFVVIINQKGEIMASHVVKYREAYGGEIGNMKWLSQFNKLTDSSKYIVGKNIDGISGATISVNSLSKGIQKIAVLFPLIKDKLN
jgi:Na+-translocating ferredoxin:NAD+ oxidoreductase RnfG subunit